MIALGIDCGTQSLKTIALDGDSGQILADIFSYPVITMQSAEGAAIHGLLQAASIPLGDFAGRCRPVHSDSRLEPKRTDFYNTLLEKQNALRPGF